MSKNKKSPLKFVDPMTAMLVISAGKGIYDMVSGGIKSSRARKDKELAQEAFDIRKQAYEDFDFNIQNPYEDIDLSTKAQEIAQESQSQQLATTLQSLKASAGTSGSAALATSIARASAAAGQKAQAVTEQREMQMQERAAKAQLSIDASERQFELSRMSNLMKSDMNALMAAQQAQAAGQQQFAQGLGNLAAAGLQYGMEGGFTRSTDIPLEEVQQMSPPEGLMPETYRPEPMVLPPNPFEAPRVEPIAYNPLQNTSMTQPNQFLMGPQQYSYDQFGNLISAQDFYSNKPR
jgi:hypothetical protein